MKSGRPRARGKRIVFLLGAGISFDLLPLSRRLTDIVRNGTTPDGREAWRSSDSAYYLVGPTGGDQPGREDARRVRAFLAWLAHRLPETLDDYEAAAFCCRQIRDAITGEAENPLLQPWLAEAEAVVQSWPYSVRGHASAEELTREALNYIAGIVCAVLASATVGSGAEVRDRAYLPLLEACAGAAPEDYFVDLITLNHDNLLEQCLRDRAITVEDGFRPPEAGWTHAGEPADVRFWRGYRRKRRRVRLVKLHGSIDWWRLRPLDGDWAVDAVARLACYPQRLWDATRREWGTPDFAPVILIGTFNKILDYTRPFHLQHYAVLRRALLFSDALVVAGYSFRDKAVNGMITDWYYTRARGSRAVPPRLLVVIGPHFADTSPPDTARGAIANKWVRWHRDGRMKVISLPLRDITWRQVVEALGALPS